MREPDVSEESPSSSGRFASPQLTGKETELSFRECENELTRIKGLLKKESKARKRAEERADKSLRLLSTVLNSLDSKIWLTDAKTAEILFTTNQLQQAGQSEQSSEKQALTVLDQPPFTASVLEHSDKECVSECQREFHDAETDHRFAVRHLDFHWMDSRKAQLIIAQDVTEIRRAEGALHEIEARFRATLDNAAQAIVLTDDKGRFTQVNAAWEKMYGYTAEEALELTHLDVTHPDYLEISNEKLNTSKNSIIVNSKIFKK